MLSVRQIHSLTDFLRNHKTYVNRLKETHTPEVLTINGKAELVLLDVESFQNLLDKAEQMETIEAIKEGLAAAERGELKPAEQVYAEMRAKNAQEAYQHGLDPSANSQTQTLGSFAPFASGS